MQFLKGEGRVVPVLAVFILGLNMFAVGHASAQTETVLHNFSHAPDGRIPQRSGLLHGGSSFYGVTVFGGSSDYGTVFQLTKDSSGTWSESVIYSFASGADGAYPVGGLIADSTGNLYGATTAGGSANDGVIFELSNSGGTWQETILHAFSGPDGTDPQGPLVFDKSGNLFGETLVGGGSGGGTVFELSPSNGAWTETILHSFGQGTDGYIPSPGLVFDGAGNLYGTTTAGGTSSCIGLGCGIVFQLTPSNGGWTENILFDFHGTPDGFYPNAPLLIDSGGTLYGSTAYGGGLGSCSQSTSAVGCGTVYELSPMSGGTWTAKTLHRFAGGAAGGEPDSPLVFDRAGNLVGEAAQTGVNDGMIFRLAKSSSGSWGLKILFTFNGADGARPQGGLFVGADGTLYGTTIYGGANNVGVAFAFKP
ncbi:MAG TPA: choice-of-anchor tandem repeat GloVer-containing protein [Candidatus Sulfotelmatobacter sp.]